VILPACGNDFAQKKWNSVAGVRMLAVGLGVASHAVPGTWRQKQFFAAVAKIAKDLAPLMPDDLAGLNPVVQAALP
jgi:hypothetical protein